MSLYKITPDLAVLKTNVALAGTVGFSDATVATWDFGDGTATEIDNTPAHSYTLVPPYLINILDIDNDKLTSIDLNTNALTAFDIGRYANLATLDVSGNNINSADLSKILVDLDANGLTGGTLDYSGQTGGQEPNTVASATAYDNLIAKGWSITGAVPLKAFVITVKTDNAGITGTDTFRLPFDEWDGSEVTISYDGTSQTVNPTDNTTYDLVMPSGAGTYDVTITTTAASGSGQIGFNGGSASSPDGRDLTKLIGIKQWGSCVVWTNMNRIFEDCTNLATVTAPDAPNVSGVTDFSEAFYNTAIDSIDVSNWDTSSGTNFNNTFRLNPNLVEIKGLSTWDVSSSTSLREMFRDCSVLLDVSGIYSWDVSSCTDIQGLIHNCTSITSLDLSLWNIGSVTAMNSLAQGCTSLVTLDLSGLTGTVLDNVAMLVRDCTSLTSINLTGFTTGVLTGCQQAFRNTALTTVDVSGFNTSGVTNFTSMFGDSSSLTTIIGGGSLDITSATTMASFLLGVTLNTTGAGGYDEMLIGFEGQTEPTGITFDGGNSLYTKAPSTAETARSVLVGTSSWTITDGGPTP